MESCTPRLVHLVPSLILVLVMVAAPLQIAVHQTAQITPGQLGESDSSRKVSAPTGIYWARSYGGNGQHDHLRTGSDDLANSVEQTSDEGYIVVGDTESFSGGLTLSPYAWVVKLDSLGSVEWQKSYGFFQERASSVQQTSDGGYIVAGYWANAGANPEQGYWVLKLTSNGVIDWQKAYGGGEASSIQQTSDGGYIAAGNDGFWVAKLDSTGSVEWQKSYGGSNDMATSVQQTPDGGYIVVGSTSSNGAGGFDFWVLKLNSNGLVEWQKTYGGSGDDYASSVQETADGGYVVAGSTDSFGAGLSDAWVLKLSSVGSVVWQKTYGGSGEDNASSVQQTLDGGYIVAGSTTSFGAGSRDIWILKLDATGSVQWQTTYGGIGDDYTSSIQNTTDGGYLVAGSTNSFGAGGYDFWVLKLPSNGSIEWYEGTGASSQNTNVAPSNSEAEVFTTSATPVDLTVTPGGSGVTTGSDTNAIVKIQAPPLSLASTIATEPALLIVVVAVGVGAPVIIIAIAVSLERRRQTQTAPRIP
jgi:uncharacterized delta-60 repeat protein